MPQRLLSLELLKGNKIEKSSIFHQNSHYSRRTKIDSEIKGCIWSRAPVPGSTAGVMW